jgi:DNA-binding response OmpR family regulator
MRLLLVEDSVRLQAYVGKGLRQAGYAVDLAADGEEGLWLATENAYDVIILDIMLPKLDGMAVLQRLRAAGRDTHVLLLTAKDTIRDRVFGLGQGADDYLVKPFAFEELLARIQALARRAYGAKTADVIVGDLRVDLARRVALRGGVELALRPREFALLELLALRRGALVSRTEIEAHIYDEQADPLSNVVDAAICILRRAIDAPGEVSRIETRRGAGYLLREGPQ